MLAASAIYLLLASVLFTFGAAAAVQQCLPPACNPYQLDTYAVRSLAVVDLATSCHTNAECMSKGLPLFKPSRTSGRALRARASPGVANTGALGVYSRDGRTFKGYVPGIPEELYYYPELVQDFNQALIVTLQSNAAGTTATIRADQQRAGYPYLCATRRRLSSSAVTRSESGAMTSTNLAYGWLAACTDKIEGSPSGLAAQNAYSAGRSDNQFYSETGFLTLNSETNRITGSWTNPDGTIQLLSFYEQYYTGFSVNPTAGSPTADERSIIKFIQSAL